MGCPTSYEGMNAGWTRGKLSRLTSGTLASGTKSYTYAYNAFGQRISRNYSFLEGTSGITSVQAGDVTAYSKKYYYDHFGRLIAEATTKTLYPSDTSTERIVFLYDESGMVGMEYTVGTTSTLYYFRRNLQGDVVAIYDTSGNVVANYRYDAWGNCTIGAGTTDYAVANANPIRYRGYYYDDDTGLYYCNARYYSPKWRRFISPDDTTYLDPKSVNGLNLYCYCNNDPVNYTDPSGHIPLYAIALIIIGTFAAIGGVFGGFYKGRLFYDLTGRNQENAEYQPSFGDRVDNIILCAMLGAAAGGVAVMLVAGGVAVYAGGAMVGVAAGGTAAQMFAIGALAYDVFALISVAWTGKEPDLIELPTTELPN